VVQASQAAAPGLLPALLSAGLLSPLALLWVRPDFERARSAYCKLISQHFKGCFAWEQLLGLSEASAAQLAQAALLQHKQQQQQQQQLAQSTSEAMALDALGSDAGSVTGRSVAS
jgi:hypothetical protein